MSNIIKIFIIKGKDNISLLIERASLSSADILDWASKPDSVKSFCNLFVWSFWTGVPKY